MMIPNLKMGVSPIIEMFRGKISLSTLRTEISDEIFELNESYSFIVATYASLFGPKIEGLNDSKSVRSGRKLPISSTCSK